MNPFDNKGGSLGANYSQNTLDFFREAGKWAKFLAIISFIGIGLMLLAALLAFVAGAAISSRRYYGSANPLDAWVPLFYVVAAGVSFLPARYMWIFANRAIEFASSTGDGDLEEAVRQIRNIFKYYGIVTIIYIAFSILVFFGMFIFLASMPRF